MADELIAGDKNQSPQEKKILDKLRSMKEELILLEDEIYESIDECADGLTSIDRGLLQRVEEKHDKGIIDDTVYQKTKVTYADLVQSDLKMILSRTRESATSIAQKMDGLLDKGFKELEGGLGDVKGKAAAEPKEEKPKSKPKPK
jgi:hypothetical protein